MAAVPSPKTSGIKTNVENKSDENTRPPTVEELLIQIESHLYHSVEHRASLLIAAWTCLGGQIGYFRSIEKVFQTMYRESAMLIFSGNWTKVDILFKRGLSRAIIQYSHSMGSHIAGSEGLCSALVMAIYDPWGDPAISHFFQKEDIDINKVNVFIKSEPNQLLLLRVECLVNAHCEEAAIQLCRSYLQNSAPPLAEFHSGCDNENWRLSFLEWLVRLLFRKRRLNDLIAETSTCSCHDGVRLIYRTMDSNAEDSESLTESLINLFLVRDLLFKSNYCCTSDLMNLWCELQVKKQKSITEVQDSARKLLVGHASSSAQFYLFVDVLWGKFGISLFPLYLELYVRGLTTDLNHLEAARQTEQKECVLEIENHMAAMYFKLSSLFSSVNKEISLECLFSAFSLNPTRETLDWIKKMSLQITKEKGLRAAGGSNSCKHSKGTCTHNCSYPLPVKRKAVVMCDQAIQVGDDFIAQCTDSVNCLNDSGRKKFANETTFLDSEEKVNSIEKSNKPETSSIKEQLEKVNKENSLNHNTTSTTIVNKLNENCTTESENSEEKIDNSNNELILNSIPKSDDKSTSHSKSKNLSLKDNDMKNCSKKLDADTSCNDVDHMKDSENADSQINQHVNGIDCEKDMDCSDKDLTKNPITSEISNSSVKESTYSTDDANQNLKPESSAQNQENGLTIVNGEANIDSFKNSHIMNGFTESESLPVIENEHSKVSDSCKKDNCNNEQLTSKEINNIELNGEMSIPMDIDNPDNAKKDTEIPPISGEMLEACNTLPNSIEPKESKWPESLRYQKYVTRFSHVVLDSKLPGISVDLLSDFVSVLESLRNKQLKSSSKWSQIKHLCEDYLEIVSEQRCTMLNTHHNGSIDSEADSSISELTAHDVYDFECQQSNGSVIRDRVADKSSVFKRFLNSDNVATEMATYVNLSDIHCPQIPLEKLFTEYSSSHAGHKKRHKRHRNHDKSPKKSVLRKLRHGSRVERDMIKHKKRKKRKGKHGKGHTKKHHSTHGKDNKVHSKKKKHKLKKKKDGNSGFISGDYCSDFSSEMLMRIVKEHSNSYSKTLATTSKHPHNINTASSSDSGEPSRKKRKVSFNKKHGKIVKYRDKHKHVKSKSDKHKKKITLESCKASVTNVIHNNPSNDIKGPHFLQISRVKKMESVQIQQSSVSMVDDSLNGTSVIDPCGSNPELKQFVQQNFESYSPDDIMKMQLLMARQQAEVTAGSSTMTSNQALRKYVCSKMTSQLLSVAQSSKCTIHSDSETSKSPTPNYMNKTSKIDKSKITKPQGNPQKLTANIKHFVIETNKPSYRMPNSNIRNVTSSVVPVNISGNQYSDAQNLIGSMLNSNIRCPTSQGGSQVTAFSIPFAHNSTGNKVVTSKIIIPLPSSSQAQSGASSNLSLIPAENSSSFTSTPNNASHSSFIIVKNGNSTQILPGPQNPCNILSCIPNLNVPKAIITNKVPIKPRTTKQPRRAQPVVKRSLIKNPLPIKTTSPNIPDSVPKVIPLRGPPPVSTAVMESSQNNLSNSDVLDLSSNVSEQTNSKISNSLSVPLEPPMNLSKLNSNDPNIMKEKINTNETLHIKPERFISLNNKESNSNDAKKIEEPNDLTINKSDIICKDSALETSLKFMVTSKPTEVLSSSTISTDLSTTVSKAMNLQKVALKSKTPETSKSINELNAFDLTSSSDIQNVSSVDVSRARSAYLSIESSVNKSKTSSSEVLMPSAVEVPIRSSADVPMDSSFDVSKANSDDIQEVNSIENAKENLAELPKDSLTYAIKTCSIEVPRDNSAEVPKECSSELLARSSAEISKESSAEILKESSAEISKESSVEILKESSAKILKDNSAEIPKESSAKILNDNSGEIPKECSAKISKDSSAEILKEISAKLPKEMSAKLLKEISAKLPKGRPAKLPKERSAKLPKGRPAKLPRGRSAKLPRESSDEIPKERLDEIFRECSAEVSKEDSTEIAKVTSTKIPDKNLAEVTRNSSYDIAKAISTEASATKSFNNDKKNTNDLKVAKSKFLKTYSNESPQIDSLTEAGISDSKMDIKATLDDSKMSYNSTVNDIVSSDTKASEINEKIKSEDTHVFERIKVELQKSLSEKGKNINNTRKVVNPVSKSSLETELFTKSDPIKNKFSLTQPSISATYDEKSFKDRSINSSNTSTLLETESIHDNKTSPDTKSDVLTEKENKALLLDQEGPIDNSPLSKECDSPSKDTDQRKQLQPINSISIMASLKTSKEKSSIKSDGVPVSEVPTRSFTSISDAVRFSLMDMDDGTDSVENQVIIT